MGLFSSKTQTYVASSVYNLAGDEADQEDVIKLTVLGSALSKGSGNLSEDLKNVLTGSVGAKHRKTFNWLKSNHPGFLPTATVTGQKLVDGAVISSALKTILGLTAQQTARVTSAIIDTADIDYFAEAWIFENHPELSRDEWIPNYDENTQEIIIEFSIGDPPVVTQTRIPAPADLLWGLQNDGRLLYAVYQVVTLDPVTDFSTYGPEQLFVYRMGSGNVVFDTLETPGSTILEFYPALPIKIQDKMINDPAYADTYAVVQKAFKKMTGDKVTEMISRLEDNPDIDDIDFAFMMSGVSLNTVNPYAQEYLYKFFELLAEAEVQDKNDWKEFQDKYNEYVEAFHLWEEWQKATDNDKAADFRKEEFFKAHPELLGVPPTNPSFIAGPPAMNMIKFAQDETDLTRLRTSVEWAFIEERLYIGNAKTYDGVLDRGFASAGDYWVHLGTDYLYQTRERIQDSVDPRDWKEDWVRKPMNRFYLFHQIDQYRFTRMTVVGAKHYNSIYDGHSVEITAKEALESEEISGFILPLHDPTIKAFGLSKLANLAGSCSYLVLNSYEQVKIPWYASKFFKFLLLAAAIGLSIVFPGLFGLSGGTGILGSNIALGTYLGASVASAAIVGAIANQIAAVVISSLIKWASTEIFGDKLGAIIGTIATFFAFKFATNYMNTGNFDIDWSELFSAKNLLSITSSVTESYTAWLNADTAAIGVELENLSTNYEKEMSEIEKLSEEILGMTNGAISSMLLTDATEDYNGESSESFLTRTLLTGSDIVMLSHALIEDFSSTTLQLPMAIR